MEAAKVDALLEDLCQTVGGKWLLLGGSVGPLESGGNRALEELDLLSISHPKLSAVDAQAELVIAATRIGLDPKTLNTSARFFLEGIKNWQNQILVSRRGPKGIIYKPSLTLFTVLKLKRGTELDMQDIEQAVKNEGVDAFAQTQFLQMADPDTIKLFRSIRGRFDL
ncbi:MAG: hypothetical protein H7301_06670 [Cryobacterium sp.]|nr:hypothetical protein [Oligoflexia bacterium]